MNVAVCSCEDLKEARQGTAELLPGPERSKLSGS